MKFAKRSDVKMFLVSQDLPPSLVKAAVNEGYNYEQDGDTRDLCYRSIEEPDFKLNSTDADASDLASAFQPTFVTPEDALAMYNTFADMMTVEEGGIAIDGEVLYDLNGDHLLYQQ